MTTFHSGPADGVILGLRRAPTFLRVVVNRYGDKKTWDALDQLSDTPKSGEDVYVYRLIGTASRVHIRFCGGRHGSGHYAVADYEFVSAQPVDAVLRKTESWREWCEANKGATT